MSGNFSYWLRILRKTSPLKAWNALVLFSTYHFSRLTGTNFHSGFPLSFAVEPTTSCNLRCPECPSGLRSFTRPTGNLKSEAFRDIVDQLQYRALYLTFYFQGEPFLNPHFLEMVSYASRRGLITSTSTNAHFLDDDTARKTVESGLDRLIISIDGLHQESYESYRIGGKLSKVIEGTKHILRWRRELRSASPQVVFQFLVVRQNEHEIDGIQALGRELGVDKVVLKSAQISEFESGSELIPENVEYSRYRRNEDGTWSIRNKLLNQCWRMWSSCVVTWDGDIVPCCFDKDAKHKLGNAFQERFEEIWNGEAYNSFRNSILRSRKEIDICTNCTEGTKVWL